MFPRFTIDLKKLQQNLDALIKITKDQGKCSLMIVTKGLCADRELSEMLLNDERVDYLADSRIQNIKSYSGEAKKRGKETVLIRLPMHCEIEETVRYADISFNSEISTIRLLDEEAARQGKTHKILLMIDVGDLREGIFYKEEEKIFDTVEEILQMKNIGLLGVGVNLTCYGAIIPKYDNLSLFVETAEKIERKFGIKFAMLSGGNSSSVYLIPKKELPERINNLRLGEAFLLGSDTAYGGKLPGTTGDALILSAQIIELQEKPSLPIGEAGMDAFGKKPYYEDKGIMKRAILAIGKQDTDHESMMPLDKDIEVLGSSSDHLLIDVTKCKKDYKTGDIVSFEVSYGALLKAATSKYVEKVYIK